MYTFNNIKAAVSAKFASIEDNTLFTSAATKDELWDTYLSAFPEGTNPIFRERTEHDCNCCKQYIRAAGNVLAVIDGKLVSPWDIEIGGFYQEVADAMSKLVKSKGISGVFFHDSKTVGTDRNHDTENPDVTWSHFYQELPSKVVKKKDSIASIKGHAVTNQAVLKRSVEEISTEAVEIVSDLISQNSLYRGEEHLTTVNLLKTLQRDYEKSENKDGFLWLKSVELGNSCSIRNTVIGSLLVDITDGKDLESAVKSFEDKVAPHNYKRPTALITQGMIKKAQEKVVELGIENALHRRFAVSSDVTINNVLFADRSVQPDMGVFGELGKSIPAKTPNMDKVQTVSIEKFINDILPTAEKIELMFDNKHENNLVSLIAPIEDSAENILKWGNNFSWSYKGEVADSMKDQVRAKGGNVDGDFRFTHSWNHNDDNASLMDLHIFFPANSTSLNKKGHTSDNYGNGERVGWNKRSHTKSKGSQDVDYTDPAPKGMIPVENISFPDKSLMPEGTYILKIHNWSFRGTGTGFKAEIEFDNQLHQYEYNQPIKHKEWVNVASVTLKDGVFSIEHHLDSSKTPKELWSINTQQFHKVNMVMYSPNHWDGEKTGNKHYFFVLDGCTNPDDARGFYNEFLRNDLTEHRKVFEALGSKIKAKYSDQQLSGLGFSTTKSTEVTCKITGSFNRIIKIKF